MESDSRTDNSTEPILNESIKSNSEQINNDLVQTILKEINTAQQVEETKQLPTHTQQQYVPLNMEQPPEIYKQQPTINMDPTQYQSRPYKLQNPYQNLNRTPKSFMCRCN